jgi:hypothetical protein
MRKAVMWCRNDVDTVPLVDAHADAPRFSTTHWLQRRCHSAVMYSLVL